MDLVTGKGFFLDPSKYYGVSALANIPDMSKLARKCAVQEVKALVRSRIFQENPCWPKYIASTWETTESTTFMELFHLHNAWNPPADQPTAACDTNRFVFFGFHPLSVLNLPPTSYYKGVSNGNKVNDLASNIELWALACQEEEHPAVWRGYRPIRPRWRAMWPSWRALVQDRGLWGQGGRLKIITGYRWIEAG